MEFKTNVSKVEFQLLTFKGRYYTKFLNNFN